MSAQQTENSNDYYNQINWRLPKCDDVQLLKIAAAAKREAKRQRVEYTRGLYLNRFDDVYVNTESGWQWGYVTRIIRHTGRIYVRVGCEGRVEVYNRVFDKGRVVGFYPNAKNCKTKAQYYQEHRSEYEKAERERETFNARRTGGSDADYELLGLTRGASRDQIKNAYREACMRYHPDRPNGDEEKMKEINAAYDRIIGAR